MTLNCESDNVCQLRDVIRFHLGSSRKIHPGQKIHISLTLIDPEKMYTPKARPLEEDSDSFWLKFRGDTWKEDSFKHTWIEFDLYEDAEKAIEVFSANPNNTNASQTLREIGMSSKRPRLFFSYFTSKVKRGFAR